MSAESNTRFLFLTLLLGVIAVATAAANPIIPGQAIVKLGAGINSSDAFSGAGVSIVDSIPSEQLFLVSFPDSFSFESKRNDLAAKSEIATVNPNYLLNMVETHQMGISFPDDDVPVHSDSTEPVPYYSQPAMYTVDFDSAHMISQGNGIRIAVIDNGFDPTHPLFENHPDSLQIDFIGRDYDPSEEDGALFGHGTFVTGLVHLGAPQAELLIVRCFDGDGLSSTFTVVKGIKHAVKQNAHIINMSFGTTIDDNTLADACQGALDVGITLVASVGNNGIEVPVYPAAYPGVIAVSAIDSLDVIASFSNGGEHVDVCAPGVNLYSALPAPYYWGSWSGTSFSAPLASATATLIRSLDNLSDPFGMEQHLRTTAERDLTWGTVVTHDLYYGYGRLDAFEAVVTKRLGDMDNSGTLDVSDLNAVSETVETGRPPNNGIRRQADVNNDGVVNQADVNRMSDKVFGKD